MEKTAATHTHLLPMNDVVVEQDRRIALVRMNRPTRRNALGDRLGAAAGAARGQPGR